MTTPRIGRQAGAGKKIATVLDTLDPGDYEPSDIRGLILQELDESEHAGWISSVTTRVMNRKPEWVTTKDRWRKLATPTEPPPEEQPSQDFASILPGDDEEPTLTWIPQPGPSLRQQLEDVITKHRDSLEARSGEMAVIGGLDVGELKLLPEEFDVHINVVHGNVFVRVGYAGRSPE